jgi:hypothetical protein
MTAVLADRFVAQLSPAAVDVLALLNHTELMLQLEREYANRVPGADQDRHLADPQGLPDRGGTGNRPATGHAFSCQASAGP